MAERSNKPKSHQDGAGDQQPRNEEGEGEEEEENVEKEMEESRGTRRRKKKTRLIAATTGPVACDSVISKTVWQGHVHLHNNSFILASWGVLQLQLWTT